MEEIKISEAESSDETTEETTDGKEVTATSSDGGETIGESSSEESVAEDAVMPDDEVMAEDEVMPDCARTLKGYDRELQIPDFLMNRGKNAERRNNSNTSFSTSPREKKVRKSAKVENSENAKTLGEQETETEAGTADEMTSSNAKAKARSKGESRKESNAEKNTYHTSNYVDENADKRKKKKKLKDVLKIALTLCGFAVIALVIIQANKLYKSRLQTDDNGNLYRNLDYKFSELTEEPVGRTTAWDNELKGFVEDDMAKAKKKRVNLTYEYGSQEILFEYEAGDFWLRDIGTAGSITNCSIYKNSSGEILVYGTNLDGEFVRVGFSKLQGGYNFLGNYNVPLNIETTAVAEMIEGYYLCIDENKVFICKDKTVVTTANYNMKSKLNRLIKTNIGSYYSSYPLIYTEDKSLYLPIVIAGDDEKVKVELKPLASDINIPDDVSYFECIDVDDYWLSIPMFENGSESMLFIPNNMDVYSEYFCNEKALTSDQEKEADWQAVPLKQQIIKAVISYTGYNEYTYKKWCVKLYLNVADKIATYEYQLDGIDTSVEVPDAEKEAYNCYSEDEYWNAVEEIRNLYSRYYSNRPE